MKANGSQLFARLLATAGVEVVSGIPGHTVMPFANELRNVPSLRPFLVRHEAISAFAADVYFRVSGRLMTVFAHSLPGISNMAAGIGNAYADSSAMLVVVGETATEASGRGAYQELARSADGDVPQFLRHIVKRSFVARSPYQLVEQTLKAIKISRLGRPGPVALHVQQEVWDQEIEIPDWPTPDGYLIGNAFRPDANSVDRAAELLKHAKRPLILAGHGVNLARGEAELRAFADQTLIPVATTVTGKSSFPEDHAQALGPIGWVGTGCANWAGRNADVVLCIGARLTESTTSSWQPGMSFNYDECALIQCDVEPAEIANVFPVAVGLIGDAGLCLRDLAAAMDGYESPSGWNQEVAKQRQSWKEAVAELASKPGTPMAVGPVVAALRAETEGQPLAIVCDIGKHAKWIAQQFTNHADDIVVSSMGAGTMGIGPCGVVGAALGAPHHRAVAWVGDGGLSMTQFVLPTVAEYGLPIVYIVINDHSFGEVANVQEIRFGTSLFAEFNAGGNNPGYRLDLARVAETCGIPSKTVTDPGDLRETLRWAFDNAGPALVDVYVDRKSRVPAAGGSKLNDIWNHPIHPWARTAQKSAPAAENVPLTKGRG